MCPQSALAAHQFDICAGHPDEGGTCAEVPPSLFLRAPPSGAAATPVGAGRRLFNGTAERPVICPSPPTGSSNPFRSHRR